MTLLFDDMNANQRKARLKMQTAMLEDKFSEAGKDGQFRILELLNAIIDDKPVIDIQTEGTVE